VRKGEFLKEQQKKSDHLLIEDRAFCPPKVTIEFTAAYVVARCGI
jgi:hypothetical protein